MINWRELELLLSELPLENSYIQKVTEHSVHSFTLSMFSREEKAWLLYFEIATPDAVVCRTEKMRKKAEGAQRFTQYMRAHFTGRKVTSVRQLPFDRAFVMKLTNSEDTISVLVRLFSGIGANIIVMDEDDTILELMYRRPQRGEEKGRKLVIDERTSEGDKHFEVRPWEGDSFNRFIDEHGRAKATAEENDRQLERLQEKRDKELAMLSERLRRQEERVKATSVYEEARKAADILSASIHLVSKGMSRIELPDWDGNIMAISLDPALSPNENLEKLYQRYRKDKKTYQMALEEAEETREAIRDTEEKYNALIEEENMQKISRENAKEDRSRIQQDTRPGIRVNVSGWDIIIGRSAKENDEILRRDAKGMDIWMHTRDYSGAYVIIKAKRDKTVPLPVLLDAASLAIHYSKAKKNGKADLYYTYVKFLRRAKDGPKGLVIPTQEKNLSATLDEKRVKEILS